MDWLQFCFHRTPEMCWKIYVKKTHSLFRKRYSKRMLRAMYVHFNCINWQTLGKLSQPSHCGHLCLFWLSDLFFCPSFYFYDYKTLDPKIWKQIFFPIVETEHRSLNLRKGIYMVLEGDVVLKDYNVTPLLLIWCFGEVLTLFGKSSWKWKLFLSFIAKNSKR